MIKWSNFFAMERRLEKSRYFFNVRFNCHGCFLQPGFHCESFLPDAFIDRATGPNRADGYSDSTSKRKQCDWQRCETPRAKRCSSIKDRLRHARPMIPGSFPLFNTAIILTVIKFISPCYVYIYIYFLEKFKEMQQVKLSAPKHELHALPKQRFQHKILPSKLSKLRFKLHRITYLSNYAKLPTKSMKFPVKTVNHIYSKDRSKEKLKKKGRKKLLNFPP